MDFVLDLVRIGGLFTIGVVALAVVAGMDW